YAHLPGEVRATLAAAREGGWSRVIAVFQPHRYSRTARLWRDFGDACDDADVVVLTDVYGAGEPPQPGVSGRLGLQAVGGARPRGARRAVPFAQLTTYRLAGPAAVLVPLAAAADVEVALAALADFSGDVPMLVVGRGSNLLVADEGFAGVALVLEGDLAGLEL